MKVFSNKISNSKPIYTQVLPDSHQNIPLSHNLSENLNILQDVFNNCKDVIFHEFTIDYLKLPALLIFISDLVDIKLINEEIMPSLLNVSQTSARITDDNMIDPIKKNFIRFADLEEISTIGEVIDAVLNGITVLLVNNEVRGLKLKTTNFKDRTVAEPTIEKLIRGPKEAFTENVFTNISLLRRKIKSSELKFEEHILGRSTQTKVEIAYLQGIADEYVIDEVKKRIEGIDVDSILESGYVEELIEDTPYTLFPLIQHSERPDKIAAGILEGRVAVLVDGTPFVLLVPVVFPQFFQSCDDYYERFPAATAVRIIRFIFVAAALLLPGLYVAVITYHNEMIPTRLAITILRASHQIPFPIFIEALIMELTFEALREAGIRLPGPANQTVGIVGVLVIGDAAVRAGLVSPITVVIIAVTAVSSFGIPSYDMGYAFRILRFAILVLGAFLGLYGILIGILIIMFHLASLKSFGVYYLSPIAPLNLKGLKDFILRLPWWTMDERPGFISSNNKRRQKYFSKPGPLHRKEN